MTLKLRQVSLKVVNGVQVIAGQGTFNLLAVEELFKAVSTGAPSAKFGIAFAEGSDNRTLRTTGNDADLIQNASSILRDLNAGHYFIVLLKDSFPIQVLNNIKLLATTVNVQVASGNALTAVVVDLQGVSAVVGFTDGLGPKVLETSETRNQRRKAVRAIGYLESEADEKGNPC